MSTSTTTTPDSITANPSGGTTFAGPGAVNVMRATVIGHALLLYHRTKMLANRAYTPKAMIRAAEQITGQQFKARAYEEAGNALIAFARNEAARINITNQINSGKEGRKG
jgi:hypothetical protein